MRLTVAKSPTKPARLLFLTKDDVKRIADFSGERDEITVRYDMTTTLIMVGLGEKKECTPAAFRSAAATGIRKALDLKRPILSLLLPENTPDGEAAVEGALLGTYHFDKYKSEKAAPIEAIEFVSAAITLPEICRIETMCAAVRHARDLVNDNASVVTPQLLADEAESLGKTGNLKVTVLDEKNIAQQGLDLLGAVGQGSPTPPRLILIEYTGDKSSKEKTAIIGKGITFDSGGQNLKPTGHIETMRGDMAGAAAVLGIMQVLSVLKPKINVAGCIAAAHNAVGDRAFFPGDIHPSFEGKTVEILSTDAEGRLVLADAISWCRKRCTPTRIVDLATLTGSILMTFGDGIAGLFSNNDALAGELFAAGERTGERLWRLPLYPEFRESMKSDIADLRNLSKLKKGYAGAITGAAFIQEFTGDLPWAHLDIAGTAWNEGPARGEAPQYATGFGVRLLLDLLTRR